MGMKQVKLRKNLVGAGLLAILANTPKKRNFGYNQSPDFMIATPTPALPLPTHLQTVEEFEQWEQLHPHEGSYEFVRGRIIEKTEMKQAEAFLIKFLNRIFITTSAFLQGDELFQEMDAYVDGVRKRRPDLAYFTASQIQAMQEGQHVSTRFAIEILSDSESYEDVLEKIQDYFDAGAELVWYIVPKQQKIYVSNSADESKAYKGTDVIAAIPTIPDFQFTVSDLFTR